MKRRTYILLALTFLVGTASAQTAAPLNLVFHRGSVVNTTFSFNDAAGDPIDMRVSSAMDSVSVVIKRGTSANATTLATYTCADDSELTCNNGSVVFLEAVNNIGCPGTCRYELRVRESGLPASTTWLAGTFTVQPFGVSVATSGTQTVTVRTGSITATITAVTQATSLAPTAISSLTEVASCASGSLLPILVSGNLRKIDCDNLGTDDQTALEVPSTPTGNVAATNTQDAIAELEAEKLAKSDTTGLMFTETRAIDALSDADGFAAIPPQLRVASVSALNGSTSLVSASGKGQVYLERYAASDSLGVGSGWLYADTADGTTADDGCRVFVDGNGVRWKRPYAASLIRADDCGFSPTSTDDNAAAIARLETQMQAAVGERIHLAFDEPGTYDMALGPDALCDCSIALEDSVTMTVGAGVELRRADGWNLGPGSDWHIVRIDGKENVSVLGPGTINGNHNDAATIDAQSHSIYVIGSTGTTIKDLYLTNEAEGADLGGGDCIFLTNNTDVEIAGSRFIDCGRSGVANHTGNDRVRIADNHFDGTGDQHIDIEPSSGSVSHYVITGNTFLDNAGQTAVTLTGSGTQTSHIHFSHNIVDGLVQVLTARHVTLSDNTITNADGNAIQITGNVSDLVLRDNHLSGVGNAVVIQQNSSTLPRNIAIRGGSVTSLADTTGGITFQNVVGASVSGVALRGAGGGTGVEMSTAAAATDADIGVTGSTIYNFATGVVLRAQLDTLQVATVADNRFGDDQGTATMTTGISLIESSSVLGSMRIYGNTYERVTTSISGTSAVDHIVVGGDASGGETWKVFADPQGALDAPQGTVAIYEAGGANNTLFVKESASGSSTGWLSVASASGGGTATGLDGDEDSTEEVSVSAAGVCIDGDDDGDCDTTVTEQGRTGVGTAADPDFVDTPAQLLVRTAPGNLSAFRSLAYGNTGTTGAYLWAQYYGPYMATQQTSSTYSALRVYSGMSATATGGTLQFEVRADGPTIVTDSLVAGVGIRFAVTGTDPILSASNGLLRVFQGALAVDEGLTVGSGILTSIDGVDDLHVEDDAEIDGDLHVEGSASVGTFLTLAPIAVSALPAAAGATNRIYHISDGAAAGDCTTGGGTTRVLCVSNGSAWVSF